MRTDYLTAIAVFLFLLLQGCTPRDASQDIPLGGGQIPPASLEESPTSVQSSVPIDFSQFHPAFRFAADIPASWQVEFVPEIVAVNIYDPAAAAPTKREQSQFFIRFFEANSFLTLSTVNILSREESTVGSHDAVRYEIERKPSVPPFPHQPSWRSGKHRLVDVRLAAANPSLFYVFTSHPSLDPAVFERFLQSLRFHNDAESYRPPLPHANERVTKKPFGLEVSPDRSPLESERFNGFHTGSDCEIFLGEESADIAVSALCGGVLRSKQRAEGYGGVVVQECLLDDQAITVVYGHLALQSVTAAAGSYLAPGAKIGLLGAGGSEETDDERKHLHIGIHRGTTIDIAGYVQRAEQLSAWMDPADFL